MKGAQFSKEGIWKSYAFTAKMVNKMVSVRSSGQSLAVQDFGEHPPRSTINTTHISQTSIPTPSIPPKPNIKNIEILKYRKLKITLKTLLWDTFLAKLRHYYENALMPKVSSNGNWIKPLDVCFQTFFSQNCKTIMKLHSCLNLTTYTVNWNHKGLMMWKSF